MQASLEASPTTSDEEYEAVLKQAPGPAEKAALAEAAKGVTPPLSDEAVAKLAAGSGQITCVIADLLPKGSLASSREAVLALSE